MRSILIDQEELHGSLPVAQTYPACHSLIRVTALGQYGQAWSTACDCGQCNSTFRGL